MSYQQECRHAVVPQEDGTFMVIVEVREVGPWEVVARQIIRSSDCTVGAYWGQPDNFDNEGYRVS